MKTRVFTIDAAKDLKGQLGPAARIIKHGGIVAFPTETVYGLGANAYDPVAVGKIFEAKQRPADDPLIVHVAALEMVESLVMPGGVSGLARQLMDRFWPGPLTIVLEKSPIVPNIVTAELSTVAIRMPSHPIAHAFIEAAGVPIAAPSANLFEHPSPTKAIHVLTDLEGRIDAVIDGGDATIGVESTIIDLSGNKRLLLRPGGVTLEEIEAEIGTIDLHPSVKQKYFQGLVRSPGMKLKHYAPDARLVLVEGSRSRVIAKIKELASENIQAGNKTAVLLCSEDISVDGVITRRLGKNQEQIAKKLFDVFREMNTLKVDIIIAECTTEDGLGLAIMNRLRKAAEEIIKT
ncbi:MAG TPA: L-threonylcarbamoyladenylate synthase [Candidatus Lokiarchaeia archaeon]|nr:L-threonylcarbamoyladenylate synthase [Candidatus Lokiarchaeia archaeon]